MKLVLLRHGETAANEEKRYCGATDLPLSAAGEEQLRRRKQAAAYPDVQGYTAITSGLLRCEQTLRILYGDVSHTADSAFREMDFGAFEMHSYEELKNDPRYLEWIAGDNELKPTPGGESGAQMTARVLEALSCLIKKNENTLIVTHGGVIAAIMAKLFEREGKNRYDWQPAPGGGYIVDTGAKIYRSV